MTTQLGQAGLRQSMLSDGDERVRRAMLDLPEEQAILVRQAFFLGRSHSQIAEDTGLPLGTVKSRIRLAFARLRRTLEGDGGDMTVH